MKITRSWDEERGIATVTFHCADGSLITEQAYVHPEDKDMKNEYTGLIIASTRAAIRHMTKYIQQQKAGLQALNHYKSVIDQSKRLNPQSYEYKALLKEIKNIELNIEVYMQERKSLIESLQDFISSKDEFYKRVRANRDKKANNK